MRVKSAGISGDRGGPIVHWIAGSQISASCSPGSHGDTNRRRSGVGRESPHLPAIGFRLQMRPDALPCQWLLSESRNDVQVSVEDFLPAHAPAVPTDVVSVG